MTLNENDWLDEKNWTVNEKLIFIGIKLRSNLQLTPEEQLLWQKRPCMKPCKITREDLQETEHYEREGDKFWQEFSQGRFPPG